MNIDNSQIGNTASEPSISSSDSETSVSVNLSRLVSWQQVSLRWIIIRQILFEASRYWSLTYRESKSWCDNEHPDEDDDDDDEGEHNEDGNRECNININNWHTRFDTDKWQINILNNNQSIDIQPRRRRGTRSTARSRSSQQHTASITNLLWPLCRGDERTIAGDVWLGNDRPQRINRNKDQLFELESTNAMEQQVSVQDDAEQSPGIHASESSEEGEQQKTDANGWRMQSDATQQHPEQLNAELVWFYLISNWPNGRIPRLGLVTRNITTTRSYNRT